MEPASGTVIFDQDMHKPWPLASMTKMMLMLIVAEKLHDGSLKLTDQVTTSALAVQNRRLAGLSQRGRNLFTRRHDEGGRGALGQ